MDNNSPRTHLKKIKRPVNRVKIQYSDKPQYEETTNTSSNDDFNDPVNSYLDQDSLPVKQSSQNIYPQEQLEENPEYLDEETYQNEVYGRNSEGNPEWLTTKIFIMITLLSLFVGIVTGKVFLAENKVVRNGLQGVVVNVEIPRGRARCGVAERAQGCVLYIMNPQRQDMRAKDFYDLAAQMTGRQRFMIETGNMRYANSKIRPGEVVQLNIPPL